MNKRCKLSIGSFVFGLLGLTVLVGCLPGILAAISAVLCGHRSLSRIKASHDGSLRGKGLALTGLILGYACLACFAFLLVLSRNVVGFWTLL